MRRSLQLLALPLLISSTHALADTVSSGLYIGGGVGQSNYDSACEEVGSGVSCDDKDTSVQVTVGFQVNPSFSIEGSWQDLGEASASGDFEYLGYDVSAKTSFTTEALRVDALGFLPINDAFSFYGKLGFAQTDVKMKEVISVPELDRTFPNSESDKNIGLTYGIGARMSLSQLEIRVGYELFNDVEFKGQKQDIDNLSVQALMHF